MINFGSNFLYKFGVGIKLSKRFYWIHIIYLFWGCIPFKETSLDSNSLLSNLVFLYRLQNVSTIRFDPPSGFYNAFQQIKISSSLQNVSIHYTIDGSDPTIDSPIYSSEISIWNLAGRNLRAVEFRGGVISGRITDSGIYKYSLLKTGAGPLTSYTLSDKEDGFLQKGISQNYTGLIQHPQFTNDYTTKDNSTGLIWKGCYQGLPTSDCSGGGMVLMNWQDTFTGINSCNSLNSLNGGQGYAGIKDWRLPTLEELASLVNYGKETNPRINDTIFPATPGGNSWTRTEQSTNLTSAFAVDFSTGGYPIIIKTTLAAVRCVSGSIQNFRGYQFKDNSNGTVEGLRSGSLWQKCNAGQDALDCSGTPLTYTWTQALDYCDNLILGERSNWRLPNRNELFSLIDYRLATNPMIDVMNFPNSFNDKFWTATTSALDNTRAATASFGTGAFIVDLKTTLNRVRCVTDL